MRDLGIYIHWPFCKSICNYCNFNKYPIGIFSNSFLENFSEWYVKELIYHSEIIEKNTFNVKSIFFGGGTPSLMLESDIDKIINCIYKNFKISKKIEITCEMNPDSASLEKLKKFKNAGINRVSLGVQSFINDDLKILGRAHNSEKSIQVIKNIEKLFSNYSIDLISNRHMQNPQKWEHEIEIAAKLNPPHISIYNLSIEKNTQFYELYKQNKIKIPEDKDTIFIDKITEKIMKKYGYKMYEISNFAKEKQFESIHNKIYWKTDDYLGIGPGSHGRITQKSDQNLKNYRYETVIEKNPKKWVDLVSKKSHGIEISERIDYKNQINELLIMSLRLKNGFKVSDFYKKFGITITNEIYRKIIDFSKKKLLKIKILEESFNFNEPHCYKFENLPKKEELCEKNFHIKATKKGMCFLNEILRQLMI